MKAVAALLVAMVTSNCSLVVSERAVGDKPVNAAPFAGTWQAVGKEEGVMTFTVPDPAAGKVATRDGDDVMEFELREQHGWVFANRVVADEGATGFAWYRVEMAPGGQSFRLWKPDASAFEELIVAGKLKGRVIDRGQQQPAKPGAPGNPPAQNQAASGTIVIISEKDGDWIRKMMEGRFGDVFEGDNPEIYVRMEAPGEVAEDE